MQITAWSLGVGSCYVSRAEVTFKTDLGKEIMEKARIPEDYIARVYLCLGYPYGLFGNPKKRKENRIKFLK